MEFPVIRAFQQDQTLYMGKKVDVILDLWDMWVGIIIDQIQPEPSCAKSDRIQRVSDTLIFTGITPLHCNYF